MRPALLSTGGICARYPWRLPERKQKRTTISTLGFDLLDIAFPGTTAAVGGVLAALARASRRSTRRVDGRSGMRWKGHGSVSAITVVRHERERERRVRRRAATGRRSERGRKRFGGAWANGVFDGRRRRRALNMADGRDEWDGRRQGGRPRRLLAGPTAFDRLAGRRGSGGVHRFHRGGGGPGMG